MRGIIILSDFPLILMMMSMSKRMLASIALAALAVAATITLPAAGSKPDTAAAEQDWPFYGGDQGGTKYSPVADINRESVARLSLAWEWSTGEKPLPEFGTRPGAFEVTPLMIDNV